MRNKIITNMTLEKYDRKYRHLKYRLLTFTKKEVDDYDKKNKTLEKHYLLKNRKWCLINDIYYEIPKPPRMVWFRNLNCFIQLGIVLLGVGAISTAIIVPTYISIINNQKKIIKVSKSGGAKDLVKDINLTREDDGSYTGKIELKEGTEKSDIGDIQITVDGNKLTKDVDYTLDTETGEIKINPGVISKEDSEIVIIIEKAQEFTITFNTRVEEKIDPIIVKKGGVISQPKDPYKQYCKVKYWYKGDDKNTPYDFSSPVTESFTLSAYYTAIETKVKVYGLKDLDSFDTIDELIAKGGEVIKNCLGGLGAEQITSAEKFKNTFTDVVETDDEINATLTYELYTKEGETHSIFRTSPEYTYSLGRRNNCCGVDATSQKKMFIDKIVLKSGCDDKARLYYQERKTYAATDPDKDLTAMRRNETYKHRSSYVFEMLDIDNFELQHKNSSGDNMSLFLIKNDASNDNYIYGHYFDFESCNFNQSLTLRACKNLTINKCYFYQDLEKPKKITTHTYVDDDSAMYLYSTLENDDHVINFTNNVVEDFPRGLHLQDLSANTINIKNNKFNKTNTTHEQYKGGNTCINISKNAKNCNINIENNTFEGINSNTLKVHSAIEDSYPYLHVNNNEFYSCKYLGWSKADKTKYSLDSKDNIRNEETDITKCEIADAGTTSSEEKDLIILNWKE